LAQVHTAKNKETNEKIAVKLQYIDLRDRFAGDFLTCKYLLKLVGVFFPDFNFSWVLDVCIFFYSRINSQLNIIELINKLKTGAQRYIK